MPQAQPEVLEMFRNGQYRAKIFMCGFGLLSKENVKGTGCRQRGLPGREVNGKIRLGQGSKTVSGKRDPGTSEQNPSKITPTLNEAGGL